jgi:hypothetical protein
MHMKQTLRGVHQIIYEVLHSKDCISLCVCVCVCACMCVCMHLYIYFFIHQVLVLNQCNRMLEYNIAQKAGCHKIWYGRY